jgi:hypothetical protein
MARHRQARIQKTNVTVAALALNSSGSAARSSTRTPVRSILRNVK